MLTNRQRKVKTVSKSETPKLTAADIIAQALAAANVRGKLQAKNHPKYEDSKYIERCISSIRKSFLADARVLIKRL